MKLFILILCLLFYSTFSQALFKKHESQIQRNDTLWKWIDSKNVDKWYQPWERCILNLKENITQLKNARDDCFKVTGRPKDGIGMLKCRLGQTYRGRPCISDNLGTNISHIPLTKVVEGFDDPSQKWLQITFKNLLNNNGSLIIFGDSTTRQTVHALACEAERENLAPVIWELHHKEYYPYGKLNDSNSIVPFKYIGFNRGGNSTSYKLRHIIEEEFIKKDSILIAFNHGIWYNDDKFIQNDHQVIFDEFLNLAKKYPNKKLSIAWMESQAQHFNNSIHHNTGYYAGVHEKHFKPQYGENAKKYYKNYFCEPITNLSQIGDWRNDLVWKLLPNIEKEYNKLSNIQLSILHFRSLTAPLHDMHRHGDYPDCSHYCVTPMMYQPIWYELSLAAKKLQKLSIL